MRFATIATILLLALATQGRMLLQEDVIGPDGAPVTAPDREGNATILKNGKWHFDYTLNLAQTGNYLAIISSTPKMTAYYGCGKGNSKCSCETSFDTTKAIPTTMHMQGWGSDNTATGLEFVCTFNVEYYNAATRDSLTKCQCSLHVDIPYTKSNHWYVDCPCLQGFTYSMPKKDHVFVASDTVTGKA